MIDTGKKKATKIMLMLSAVYMASYLCRYSYAAVLPEMVRSTGKLKSELSVAVTCLFVCYGIGQLISGFLGDRISPKKLIICGMMTSIALNISVPFVRETWLINVIWSVNGLAQAFIWPPSVALLSALLSQDDYARGTVWLSFGGNIGTISLYLLSPLFVRLWSWRGTFLFGGISGLIIMIFFTVLFPNVPPASASKAASANAANPDNSEKLEKPEEIRDPQEGEKKKKVLFVTLITPSLLAIMLCILTQGFIKDGITTWMPTYISEIFNIDSAASILTGVLLPVFAMICLKLSNILNKKLITNPITCAGALFGIGAVSALILFIVKSGTAPLTVFFSVLLTGTMHGVNLMLICILPLYFKESGKISTASGLLNFTTYAGSSASAYVLAVLSENTSWNTIFLIISGVAAVSGVICVLVRNFKVKV